MISNPSKTFDKKKETIVQFKWRRLTPDYVDCMVTNVLPSKNNSNAVRRTSILTETFFIIQVHPVQRPDLLCWASKKRSDLWVSYISLSIACWCSCSMQPLSAFEKHWSHDDMERQSWNWYFTTLLCRWAENEKNIHTRLLKSTSKIVRLLSCWIFLFNSI